MISTSPGHHEQNVGLILRSIQTAVLKLRREVSEDGCTAWDIARVSLCCQMHGVVFWNGGDGDGDGDVSNLITWQDKRCGEVFLKDLQTRYGPDLHTGYGSATISWLHEHDPGFLKKYQLCGTVADYFCHVLCGLREAVISDHNAQSWGCFDHLRSDWVDPTLYTLPRIVKHGTQIGRVIKPDYHIPVGAGVNIPIGDLQGSVFSVIGGTPGRVFNYGTASQIVQTVTLTTALPDLPRSVRRTLYTSTHHLLTAASLNGGNVVQIIYNFLSSLDPDMTHDTMLQLALQHKTTTLTVNPVFFNERHDTETQASFSNVTPDNLTSGDISAAVFKGIVHNLCEMMGRVGAEGDLYAVGIAERPILQYYVREKLGDFVLYDSEVTAAYGAIQFDVCNET